MAFNLVNIEEKRFCNDEKMLDAIKNLKEKVVLLAPDRGNGVVLPDKADYTSSLEHLLGTERSSESYRTIQQTPGLFPSRIS